MLALPLLRAEGSAGLTNFSLFLKAQKYTDDALVEKEVKEFESLRASAVTITEASDLSQQQLLQYFQTLKSIAPRVANFESEMKLSFTWIDPFMNFRKHTSGSFYYEMAAVAYNLAALESTRGGRVDRATEEGIKAASKHFQQAAGFYDYILETLLPKMTLTTVPCLSVDALTMARDLMLAQAQLCFYEKSIRDRKAGKMKAGIIAKLAYQTSIFYSKASHLCKSRLSIDKSWHTLTDFQCKCFQGAAEYWQATASKEIASQVGTGYGEEVARLRRAENFITQALQVSKTNPLIPSLPAGAQALLDVIISNKKTAEYDINTVYMESIPNDSGLTDIVPVAMVKPLALPDQTSGHALFKYVIPKGVLEAKLRFTDQLNSQCTMITQEAENATNNARGQLSSVGLPGSLEAVKSQSPLPDSLWDKVQRVQKMGGVARLESMIGDVSHYAKRAYSTMCSIDDSLSREMNKDDGFRARNPDYPGVPSSKMNVDILANASKMREAYVNAQDSDKSINNDLQDPATREMLSILSKTKGDLFKMFPSNSAPNLLDFDEELDKSGVLGKDGIQLEAKLEELAELIENRSKLLDSLPQIVSTDYNEITLSAVSRGEDVYSKYEEILKNVTMIHSQVVHSVAQQKSLLDEIMALNDRFARTKDSSPLAVEKGKVIAKIEQSAAKYFSLYSKITAGVTFYSNLQSKLTTLLQSSDDLAYTQEWQRQEFDSNRNNELNRTSQEALDRELAMKLANEMNVSSAPVPNFSQQPSGTSASQNVYYGAAVSGPPTNSQVVAPAHGQYPAVPYPSASAPPALNPSYADPRQQNYPPASQSQPSAYAQQPHHYNQSNQPAPQQFQQPQYGQLNQYQQPPQQPQYGQPQINYSSPQQQPYTPSGQPYQPQQAQQQVPQPPQQAADIEVKISRLCEMGFLRPNVVSALQANNNDEEAALNSLLSGTAAQTAPAAKPSGLFGGMWGKK